MNVLRPSLAILAALTAFWLLTQFTLSAWLTREAQLTANEWESQGSPWYWDLRFPHNLILPGSHGLEKPEFNDNGLRITSPSSGAVNLSLPVKTGMIDHSAVATLSITGESQNHWQAKLLVPSQEGFVTWADLRLAPGVVNHLEPLTSLTSQAPISSLIIRLEAPAGSLLTLSSLRLVSLPCHHDTPCPSEAISLPSHLSPDRLLAARDQLHLSHPGRPLVLSEPLNQIGSQLNAMFQPTGTAYWWLIFGVLIGSLTTTFYLRLKHRLSPLTKRQAIWQLTAPLACATSLLLAGWPSVNNPIMVPLALGLCLAALAFLPEPQPRLWQWRGNAHAWQRAALITAAGLLLLLSLSLLENDVPRSSADADRYWRYPFWALVQQWLLIAVLLPRLNRIFTSDWTVWMCGGVLFALLHAPNFGLMIFTFLGGSVWSWFALTHRALLPSVVSHAILGLALLQLSPTWLVRSAEIGGRYLMPP